MPRRGSESRHRDGEIELNTKERDGAVRSAVQVAGEGCVPPGLPHHHPRVHCISVRR